MIGRDPDVACVPSLACHLSMCCFCQTVCASFHVPAVPTKIFDVAKVWQDQTVN